MPAKTVSGLSPDWKRFEVTLKTHRVAPTAKARFRLTLDQPGTVWLGLVSLFPADLERSPQRTPQRPDADAGGFETQVPPFSRRQLS